MNEKKVLPLTLERIHVQVSYNNRFIIYKQKKKGTSPAFWKHTCNVVTLGNKDYLLLFGGNGAQFGASNQIFLYSIGNKIVAERSKMSKESQKWLFEAEKEFPVVGTPPAKRESCTAVPHGNKIYVYGGRQTVWKRSILLMSSAQSIT